MKFPSDTKLSGNVTTLKREPPCRKIGIGWRVANKNLMKSSKDNCQVLHLGKHNPGVQHGLGSTQLGSISVERDLGSRWTIRSA